MAQMSMADLLAKQSASGRNKLLNIFRGQELTGEVISILPQEIILDLGTKSEGALPKKDLPDEQVRNLKIGDKLQVHVVVPENESGQVVLSFGKETAKGSNVAKWGKFQNALNSTKTFTGKGVEVNKGGLIIEVGDVRGFLPSSQIAMSQAADLSDLIGRDVIVNVIEVDPSQNRLIFSQKANVSQEIKERLVKLKVGDKVKGKVAAILPFGVFVTVEAPGLSGVEGLVHISEISWEKVEDPGKMFKIGDAVEAQVISVDPNTDRVNLSIKQTQTDPFIEASSKYKKDEVVKGTIARVSNLGVFITLEDGLEGLMHSSKLQAGDNYQAGQEVQALVDNVDTVKRRIYLAPFVTTTKGLIYK